MKEEMKLNYLLVCVVSVLITGTTNAQRVVLTSDPARAEILITGVKAGTTPLSLDLRAGVPVEITSRFPRLAPVVETVTPISGEVVRHKFQHAYGTLVVTSDHADAVLMVDREAFAHLPLVVFLPPGGHRLYVTAPHAPTKTRQVVIFDGEMARVELNLDRGSPETERSPQNGPYNLPTPKPTGKPRVRSTPEYALRAQ